jgi:RNA polymerase sigma-70 factor (ECF subfamily)
MRTMRTVTTPKAPADTPALGELVSRARDGDRDAFARIVALERDRLVAAARALTGDHHLGEDCAQEALVRAHAHLKDLRDPGLFRAWLARILVRLARRSALRARKRPVMLPEGLGVEAPRPDDAEEVRLGLAGLREGDRTILALRYLDGLGYAEIAMALRIEPKTAKSRLHEARVRLRRRLERLREPGRERG